MSANIKIFFAGALISFIGALPFGSLNVTAFRVASTHGISSAMLFSIGAVLIELIAVRITLSDKLKLRLEDRILPYVMCVAILALIALSVFNLYPVFSSQKTTVSLLLQINKPAFLLGITLSILNPLQVPFWIGWNALLYNKGLLTPQQDNRAFYISGIACGSMLVFFLFSLGGKFAFTHAAAYGRTISIIMGVLYALFALWLASRLYNSRFKLNTQ